MDKIVYFGIYAVIASCFHTLSLYCVLDTLLLCVEQTVNLLRVRNTVKLLCVRHNVNLYIVCWTHCECIIIVLRRTHAYCVLSTLSMYCVLNNLILKI